MAIRCGMTVGRTTHESSLSDQLKKFKTKSLVEEEKSTGAPKNPAHESLKSKCLKIVVANFERTPIKGVYPPAQLNEIIDKLPTSINPVIAAKYIYNESYWKRACVEMLGWHNCHLEEHGYMWKQMYFEHLMQDKLENFDSQSEDIDTLYELAEACADYIFTISFKQLPSHIDVSELFACFPNLTKLNISYGIKKIGMSYERILFGMKISDATSLAKVFASTETITTVILSNNLIDDDLLRMLMTGLIKNNTITHLDFSHNKITNHGARLLSKLLGENSVITHLDLSDNSIHAEGGRYLARGLRDNDSLMKLNLRLNRLGDDGCKLLLEGVQDNISLVDLNLASNSAGTQTALMIYSLLRDQEHRLEVVDLSCNQLSSENFMTLKLAISNNKSLRSLDLRQNPAYLDCQAIVSEIDKITHNNEYNSR